MNKRLFVLDTNVFMHDPLCLLRFHEHDVYLPMVVLEELDAHKIGLTETARNVREVNRFLDQLLQGKSYQDIHNGLVLTTNPSTSVPRGRLFFQTQSVDLALPNILFNHQSDHAILAFILMLQKENTDNIVTLVSKDINLRVKASILGIRAEDYSHDQVVDDLTDLHTGIHALPDNFWEKYSHSLKSWQEVDRTFYQIHGPDMASWFPNDGLFLEGAAPFAALVTKRDGDETIIEQAKDYLHSKHQVWGINARNREQNFALNVLMNPDIDFVTLQGMAGTGKTLLALAAGLAQTMDYNRYREIIMTLTVPLGEDIGFLPGTEEEKMTPWMGALMDNLEVLLNSQYHQSWERTATQDLLRQRIKICSLNFMRGRTFLNKYLIIDEAQNLTAKQIKTLLTRAGPGTKIVCLGDLKQIDTPYLTETTSGLTYAIDHCKTWQHSAHLKLIRGERSRLADYAAEHL